MSRTINDTATLEVLIAQCSTDLAANLPIPVWLPLFFVIHPTLPSP